MENRKIVITEKELAMAIAHASLMVCGLEENKHMETKDIMRVTAFVSAAVQNHLTGRQEFDPEEYKETKMKIEIIDKINCTRNDFFSVLFFSTVKSFP